MNSRPCGVRRRAAAAIRHALGTMTGDGALIAVCHEMVIRSLTRRD